jgi:2-methylcitrate dehydratase PrpD
VRYGDKVPPLCLAWSRDQRVFHQNQYPIFIAKPHCTQNMACYEAHMSGQTTKSHADVKAATASQILAAHASALQLVELPPHIAQAVATFTLDTIGVGIAGVRSPYAAGVTHAAQTWGKGNGAHVFATGSAMPAPSAAFVNAFMAHALEFDCVHEGAVLHPFTVVVPVLLAQAQANGMDGATFITACAAGVDVAAGLGVAAQSQIRFFRPATCGLFGATAALARARGLDADTTAHALGYALAFASGTMQAHVEGTPALAASVGGAARSAFTAVELAQAGLPGPMGAIEGPFGYLTLCELESDIAPVLDSLGKVWRVGDVSHKPFPTGRAAHGGIDMILSLRAQGLTADNLEKLTIHAPPLIHHLVGRPIAPAPLEVNYARLCLPYVGAVALVTGGVTLADFTPQRLSDPAIHNVAKRIEVAINDTTSQSAFTPQRAVAQMTEGQTLEVHIDALLGAPARPLSREQHLAKFRACVSFGFGAARPDIEDALIGATDDLVNLADIGMLGRLAAGQI